MKNIKLLIIFTFFALSYPTRYLAAAPEVSSYSDDPTVLSSEPQQRGFQFMQMLHAHQGTIAKVTGGIVGVIALLIVANRYSKKSDTRNNNGTVLTRTDSSQSNSSLQPALPPLRDATLPSGGTPDGDKGLKTEAQKGEQIKPIAEKPLQPAQEASGQPEPTPVKVTEEAPKKSPEKSEKAPTGPLEGTPAQSEPTQVQPVTDTPPTEPSGEAPGKAEEVLAKFLESTPKQPEPTQVQPVTDTTPAESPKSPLKIQPIKKIELTAPQTKEPGTPVPGTQGQPARVKTPVKSPVGVTPTGSPAQKSVKIATGARSQPPKMKTPTPPAANLKQMGSPAKALGGTRQGQTTPTTPGRVRVSMLEIQKQGAIDKVKALQNKIAGNALDEISDEDKKAIKEQVNKIAQKLAAAQKKNDDRLLREASAEATTYLQKLNGKDVVPGSLAYLARKKRKGS